MAWTERFVRADADGAGNGTTDANNGANGAYTFDQMLADTEGGSIRYNIKSGVGTYARTTNADTFTTAGAVTAPRAIRGFNVTPGDLEANGRTPGGALILTNFPLITYTTGSIVFPANWISEFLDIQGATVGTVVSSSAGFVLGRRCNIANTNTTANCIGATVPSAGLAGFIDCDFANASNHSSAYALRLQDGWARNCLLIGPSKIALLQGRSAIRFCMLRDGTEGVVANATRADVDSCSFGNLSGNYIDNQSNVSVVNCAAWGSGGSSKWYNSTTSVRATALSNNAVGNMGAGNTNLGDWINQDEVALSVDPYTSSTDMTPNNTAGGGADLQAAGLFPYLDIGAIQVQAGSGGGGAGSIFAGGIF